MIYARPSIPFQSNYPDGGEIMNEIDELKIDVKEINERIDDLVVGVRDLLHEVEKLKRAVETNQIAIREMGKALGKREKGGEVIKF